MVSKIDREREKKIRSILNITVNRDIAAHLENLIFKYTIVNSSNNTHFDMQNVVGSNAKIALTLISANKLRQSTLSLVS